MKKIFILFAVLLMLTSSAGVFAHDFWDSWTEKPWERNDPNTTYQHWDFSLLQEPVSTTHPTEYNNPFGVPTLGVEGGDLESVIGPDGVIINAWHIISPEGGIFISIPNRSEEDWVKRIFLQITSTKYTMNNQNPVTDPAATSVTSPMPAIMHSHGNWYTYNWFIEIHPNPAYETIWVPFPESTYINQVVVDTQCVPEPGSMLILGSGLLGIAGIIRRRR